MRVVRCVACNKMLGEIDGKYRIKCTRCREFTAGDTYEKEEKDGVDYSYRIRERRKQEGWDWITREKRAMPENEKEIGD